MNNTPQITISLQMFDELRTAAGVLQKQNQELQTMIEKVTGMKMDEFVKKFNELKSPQGPKPIN